MREHILKLVAQLSGNVVRNFKNTIQLAASTQHYGKVLSGSTIEEVLHVKNLEDILNRLFKLYNAGLVLDANILRYYPTTVVREVDVLKKEYELLTSGSTGKQPKRIILGGRDIERVAEFTIFQMVYAPSGRALRRGFEKIAKLRLDGTKYVLNRYPKNIGAFSGWVSEHILRAADPIFHHGTLYWDFSSDSLDTIISKVNAFYVTKNYPVILAAPPTVALKILQKTPREYLNYLRIVGMGGEPPIREIQNLVPSESEIVVWYSSSELRDMAIGTIDEEYYLPKPFLIFLAMKEDGEVIVPTGGVISRKEEIIPVYTMLYPSVPYIISRIMQNLLGYRNRSYGTIILNYKGLGDRIRILDELDNFWIIGNIRRTKWTLYIGGAKIDSYYLAVHLLKYLQSHLDPDIQYVQIIPTKEPIETISSNKSTSLKDIITNHPQHLYIVVSISNPSKNYATLKNKIRNTLVEYLKENYWELYDSVVNKENVELEVILQSKVPEHWKYLAIPTSMEVRE